MSIVELVWSTPDAEALITKMARVSAPANENTLETAPKLLCYLIKHSHWSPFAMANWCVEIHTTRSISAQIIRHRSFSFQEFSQRYADINLLGSTYVPHLRRQDTKNRQNSIDDVDPFLKQELEITLKRHFQSGMDIYKHMLEMGIAKECARFVLPLAVPTRIYMTGSVRSWIHYIELRSANGTQKEHMDIALDAKRVFAEQFPICAEALDWL